MMLLLLDAGACVTTGVVDDESELLGAVRADQILAIEILLSHGKVCQYINQSNNQSIYLPVINQSID